MPHLTQPHDVPVKPDGGVDGVGLFNPFYVKKKGGGYNKY
jgi:hypothetical protein